MKILVAVDGSEQSRKTVEECCRIIAEPDQTEIVVLMVAEPSAPVMTEHQAVSPDYLAQVADDQLEQSKKNVEQSVEMIQRHFAATQLNIMTKVEIGAPAQIVVEEAKKWNADLIVLGSHGYGFWERMLSGSVSEAVLHHAPCSVLIVREKEN